MNDEVPTSLESEQVGRVVVPSTNFRISGYTDRERKVSEARKKRSMES